MPRASYQYGTSARKYESEYTSRATKSKALNKKGTNKSKDKKEVKKSDAQMRIQQKRAKKAEERKYKTKQVVVVLVIFGMLLALSYREIAIMEMFKQKKALESQLATIQKENGQVEKSIREEESKLNWNDIQKTASEQLGMQIKAAVPIDLERTDNVETKNQFIKEDEETNLIEKIISYFINK